MFAKVRYPKVVTVNTSHEHNEVRCGMYVMINKMESTAMCMPCIPLALLGYHSRFAKHFDME